jgi:hypothetical protein
MNGIKSPVRFVGPGFFVPRRPALALVILARAKLYGRENLRVRQLYGLKRVGTHLAK